MNFLISFAVIIVFGYVIVKRRIVPRIKKSKVATAPAVINQGAPCPVDSSRATHFEVLAFSLGESANSVEFRERVALHLSNAVYKLNDRGIPFDITSLPLADTLVMILSWQEPERR